MIIGLGLLGASVVLGALGPRYLLPTVRPGTAPGLALIAWFGSTLTMLLCTAVGGVILLLPHPGEVDGLLGIARQCVRAINGGSHFPWLQFGRVGIGAAALLALLRFALVLVVDRRRAAASRASHLSMLYAVGTPRASVLWLEEDAPLAFSIGGRYPVVVATTGVDNMPAVQRAAILAHEDAHLRGRHHALLMIGDAAGRAWPFVPLCRTGPSVLRVLVEASADDVAARDHGANTVCDSLAAVAHLGAPQTVLAAADQAVEARLRWLRHPHRARIFPRTRLGRVLTGGVATVPAIAATVTSAAALVLACAYLT